jgi:hypothetical protein
MSFILILTLILDYKELTIMAAQRPKVNDCEPKIFDKKQNSVEKA